MKGMTLRAIAKAVDGELYNQNNVVSEEVATNVVIDSRLIEKGGIFVATRGARVDGHSFIPQVFEEGALGVICEDAPKNAKGPYIIVEDSFVALKKLAKYYRSLLSVKIIGIVGSVGKTSTKEMVAAVLGAKYNVLKTEGNFNNEIGVPLTLLRIRDEHEIAVIEMGISDFGEMTRLGEIVRPDCVIFTCIGPCHLEQLIDLDGVLKAKTEIIPFIKENGTIIINADDNELKKIDSSVAGGRRVYKAGRDLSFDISIVKSESLGLEGTIFAVNILGERESGFTVPLPGVHMIDNAILAIAAGCEEGLTDEEIRKGLSNVTALSGRGHLIHTAKYLIVDDCYNASPKSMCAAIDTMANALSRKVAILGDMFELGEDEEKLHAKVGEHVAASNLDSLICVGSLSKHIYEAARQNKELEIRYYPNKKLLIDALEDPDKEILMDGDTVLIKASHGMGFSEIVDICSKD